MMDELYVLDDNLEVIGLVDAYKSLIWSSRYNKLGDCELYLKADSEALSLLRQGYYLMRPDDEMVCQIRKIELDTDAENGNYLVITGYDSKIYLDQRLIWDTVSINGEVSSAVYDMVDRALINASDSARILYKRNGTKLFSLGQIPLAMDEISTEQVSYKNLGEKVREYCERYGWGYKVIYDQGKLEFLLYRGTDRTGQVIFSEDFENLSATKYVQDNTNLGNVALVAGEGEGSARERSVAGYAEGPERFEVYVDAKDISKTITYADLVAAFPAGNIQGSVGAYTYRYTFYNVLILDDAQLSWLEDNFPDGSVISISGVDYYRIPNCDMADLPSSSPADSDNVVLRDVVYTSFLLNRGYEKLAEYGAVTSFDGSVEPNTTFVFNTDYFLGDLVTVQNEYGITVNARITEVVEVNDDNGYRVEPKFEYIVEV